MNKIELKVKGMVCGGCENRVKNALGAIDGVEAVEASYQTGLVKVKAEEKVSKQTLEEAIVDIGFEIETMEK